MNVSKTVPAPRPAYPLNAPMLQVDVPLAPDFELRTGNLVGPSYDNLETAQRELALRSRGAIPAIAIMQGDDNSYRGMTLRTGSPDSKLTPFHAGYLAERGYRQLADAPAGFKFVGLVDGPPWVYGAQPAE